MTGVGVADAEYYDPEEPPSEYWTADRMADWMFANGEGALIEVFTDDCWWNAIVWELRDEVQYLQVKVHYIGGLEEEDEWVCVSSQRMRQSTLIESYG